MVLFDAFSFIVFRGQGFFLLKKGCFMQRRFTILNVFTQKPLTGNPLAVVTDAQGLSGKQMQAIAREFNLSETVFVLPALNPAHSARIRIFTPTTELPFAGHPTVGAAALLANERMGNEAGGCDILVVLEEQIGIVRVGVSRAPGEAAFAAFDVPKLPQEAGPPALDDRIAAALGLAPSEIGFENHAPTRYSAGLPFTFVPVAGLEAMQRARIVQRYWQEGFRGDGYEAAFLYCRETLHNDAAFHARVFAPSLGADEDPATGSAAAAFAGVMHHFDRLPEGAYQGIIEQGFEMGRPSQISLEVEIAGRQIRTVRIGGHAVEVMKGEMSV